MHHSVGAVLLAQKQGARSGGAIAGRGLTQQAHRRGVHQLAAQNEAAAQRTGQDALSAANQAGLAVTCLRETREEGVLQTFHQGIRIRKQVPNSGI